MYRNRSFFEGLPYCIETDNFLIVLLIFFQIEKLEADLKVAVESGGGVGGAFQTMPIPDSMATTSAEVIANLNEHLVVVLQVIQSKQLMTHAVDCHSSELLCGTFGRSENNIYFYTSIDYST